MLPHSDKSLCKWSDNLRIFETCKELKLLTPEQEKSLTKAYCLIRDEAHRLTLNKQTRIVDKNSVEQECQAVIKIWQQFLG